MRGKKRRKRKWRRKERRKGISGKDLLSWEKTIIY